MGRKDPGTQKKMPSFVLEKKKKDLDLLELKILGTLLWGCAQALASMCTEKDTKAKKEKSGSPTCFSLHPEVLILLHTSAKQTHAFEKPTQLGLLVQTYNPRTQGAKAGGLL